MGEPARDETVVDVAEYLRSTLADMDQVVNRYNQDRQRIALRLAALDTSRSQSVRDAAEDYERRVAEGRPYEDAEEADALLNEAARRYVLPK